MYCILYNRLIKKQIYRVYWIMKPVFHWFNKFKKQINTKYPSNCKVIQYEVLYNHYKSIYFLAENLIAFFINIFLIDYIHFFLLSIQIIKTNNKKWCFLIIYPSSAKEKLKQCFLRTEHHLYACKCFYVTVNIYSSIFFFFFYKLMRF